MILKFGTKLDSDKLYCVTKKQPKKQPHITYQSLYLFIFLSLQWKFPSQISQLLLEPSVFKFCVHLQVGKVYSVNENKDANPCFAFFFNFSFFLLSLLNNTYGHFFCQRFLSNYVTYDSEIW